MRVLAVEDEPDLLSSLMKALREDGYAVDGAPDGEEGLFKAESYDYDAIVLDIMLPVIDGWELLRRLRKTKKTPVLMLTARDAVRDRVRGLDTGADDYLVKPFELAELLARLRALIRRSASQAQSRLEIGDVVIDTAARTVSRRGEPIALTAREYALVEFLALHRGKVVTRTMLYEHLFDENDSTLSNLLDVHVSNVRKKLGQDFITTRRGHGYCIEARRMIFNSIRWRLQAWHGLILVAVLAGFGLTAYQVARDNQLRRIDQELDQRIMALLRAPRPDRPPERLPDQPLSPERRRPPGRRATTAAWAPRRCLVQSAMRFSGEAPSTPARPSLLLRPVAGGWRDHGAVARCARRCAGSRAAPVELRPFMQRDRLRPRPDPGPPLPPAVAHSRSNAGAVPVPAPRPVSAGGPLAGPRSGCHATVGPLARGGRRRGAGAGLGRRLVGGHSRHSPH